MKISSISDVHIKLAGDKADQLLKTFFNHKKTSSSNYIILNGDIFDTLAGGKNQYLNKYSNFFELIRVATENGSIVVYIEGNHDFHIENLIKKSIKKFSIDKDKFIHIKNKIEIPVKEKKIVFTHGDDVEIENDIYKSYKAKINNPFMSFVINYIFPFAFIEWLGQKASHTSRKSNESKYELTESGQKFVEDKFRRSAKLYFEENNNIDILVCGHSHCKDLYMVDDKVYINNGYALRSNSFIYITENGPEFISL